MAKTHAVGLGTGRRQNSPRAAVLTLLETLCAPRQGRRNGELYLPS